MIENLTSTGGKKGSRTLIVIAIAVFSWTFAIVVGATPPAARAGDFFYDTYYSLRAQQDMQNSDVVLVAVDKASLTAVKEHFKRGWPWPREFWGRIAGYVDRCGAKSIVFDLLFSEMSVYQNETGDDDAFAALMEKVKAPVVWGSLVNSEGSWEPFAPPVRNPAFGAVNVGNDKVYRMYRPYVQGRPSLAAKAVEGAADVSSADFLLHYYGPHKRADSVQTFRYIPAAVVLAAALDAAAEQQSHLSPDTFRGKIVILCAISAGVVEQDLKSSPLSPEYPGPEIHATAIEDLLHGQFVNPVWPGVNNVVALLGAFLVTAAVIYPRRASIKVAAPLLVVLLLITTGALLFRSDQILWLSPVDSLLAVGLSTPLAFGWTYFVEDRQRRFMLKALSKVVSPAVAEQLAREPERLALGTQRTQITVLFTDLANFTDLSEGMDVVTLGKLINRYLGEMSDQVLRQDGTLDKYIGDAVMCFWNAPLPQADHAARGCRAALAMIRRERELHAEFASLGTKHIFTRIGINTASVALGFIGSQHLFNYTAMGDGVNLASRLEGANKIYGTQILISEHTAEQVGALFLLRKIDVLRVQGKKQPMAVYELMGERSADQARELLAQRYEQAFAAYQARRWHESEALLLELSHSNGEDGPTRMLLERVQSFRASPPPEEWDGVYVAETK